MRERGIAVVRHHDALAGREPVVLDDMRHPQRVERRLDLVDGGADVGQPGRNVRRGHDLLGEALAALQLGRGGRRTEAGNPGIAHSVGHAGHEGCLRPDDDKVHGAVPGERGDARAVEDAAGQRFAEGHRIHARVPGLR